METRVEERVEERVEGHEKWPGPVKVKRVRDYSGGSLRDAIQRARTPEELAELRPVIQGLSASRGTLRKLERAARAKQAELRARLVVLPPTPRLLIPRHLAGGNSIVRPQ